MLYSAINPVITALGIAANLITFERFDTVPGGIVEENNETWERMLREVWIT